MTKSMTGFGKEEATVKNKRVSVEIRSLNSKGADVNTRMPSVYREKELALRNLLSEKLERGKIDFSISVESSEAAKGNQINKTVVKNYYAQLRDIAKDLKVEPDNMMGMIMRLPDVMRSEKEELDESEWKQISKLIDFAIKKLD